MSSGLFYAVIRAHVVEGSHWRTSTAARCRLGAAVRLVLAVAAAVIALCLVLVPTAMADDPAPASSSAVPAPSGTSSSGTVTDEITDTENLLGDNVVRVKDAIDTTRSQEGVHVRLLYLPSFGGDTKPDAWSAQVLEATDPEPNTVLLAIGSDDGNLVVAVSKNSDDWLRSQETVDKLSSAAVAPIQRDNPDWAGAAIALMQEVKTVHHTTTSQGVSRVGVVLMLAALVSLVLITVVVILVRRRHADRHHRPASRRRRRRRSRHAAGSDRRGSEIPPQDTDDIQATFSEKGDAGHHEQTN